MGSSANNVIDAPRNALAQGQLRCVTQTWLGGLGLFDSLFSPGSSTCGALAIIVASSDFTTFPHPFLCSPKSHTASTTERVWTSGL